MQRTAACISARNSLLELLFARHSVHQTTQRRMVQVINEHYNIWKEVYVT
jgi:hypothetical protein